MVDNAKFDRIAHAEFAKEEIAGNVSKIQNLIHLMKSCGETMTEKMIIEKVMRTLTPHFDHVIVAIQEFGNVPIMKI